MRFYWSMCESLAYSQWVDKKEVHSWFKESNGIKTTKWMTPREFSEYTESCRDVMGVIFGHTVEDPDRMLKWK